MNRGLGDRKGDNPPRRPPWEHMVAEHGRMMLERCAEARLWLEITRCGDRPERYWIVVFDHRKNIGSPCERCQQWINGAFRGVLTDRRVPPAVLSKIGHTPSLSGHGSGERRHTGVAFLTHGPVPHSMHEVKKSDVDPHMFVVQSRYYKKPGEPQGEKATPATDGNTKS